MSIMETAPPATIATSVSVLPASEKGLSRCTERYRLERSARPSIDHKQVCIDGKYKPVTCQQWIVRPEARHLTLATAVGCVGLQAGFEGAHPYGFERLGVDRCCCPRRADRIEDPAVQTQLDRCDLVIRRVLGPGDSEEWRAFQQGARLCVDRQQLGFVIAARADDPAGHVHPTGFCDRRAVQDRRVLAAHHVGSHADPVWFAGGRVEAGECLGPLRGPGSSCGAGTSETTYTRPRQIVGRRGALEPLMPARGASLSLSGQYCHISVPVDGSKAMQRRSHWARTKPG